jgi:hypothetical protein
MTQHEADVARNPGQTQDRFFFVMGNECTLHAIQEEMSVIKKSE